MLENFDFDHSQDDFIDALGLKQRDYELARMTIKYNLLAPLVIALRDSEDTDDINIPEGATSKSNILEQSLKRLGDNTSACMCAMLMFSETFTATKKQLKDYVSLLASDNPEDFFKGIKEKIAIQTESLSDALSNLGKILSLKPMAAAMSFLKDSDLDYNKFISFTVDGVSYQDALDGKTEPRDEDDDDDKDNGKDYSDIDDIIRRAFNKADEE